MHGLITVYRVCRANGIMRWISFSRLVGLIEFTAWIACMLYEILRGLWLLLA